MDSFELNDNKLKRFIEESLEEEDIIRIGTYQDDSIVDMLMTYIFRFFISFKCCKID